MKKRLNLLLVLVLFVPFLSTGQAISTQDGVEASTIILDSLISGCVTGSNVTTNGSTGFGYFTNENPSFPFEAGLILASGDISNAEGPDNATSQGSSLGSGGDLDLVQLCPTSSTINDATIIEFDFVPASDTIRFNYIFGSEEFPEFANSSFNDIFGFFISGPGIDGNFSNNAKNIAILYDNVGVTIDDVYNNQEYYVGQIQGGANPDAYNGAIEYDGASVMLTAEAVVIPCEIYHIKLAVADVGDSSYDSGVFIEAGSFTSGVTIGAVNHSDVGTEADLYEGCSNYYLVELLDGPADQDINVTVNVSPESTATEGVDFSEIGNSIFIPQGQSSDTLWYTAFNDGTLEGNETIILEFVNTCPCGNGGNTIIDTIWIYDAELIKGGIQDVETNYCGEDPPATLDLVADVNIDESFYLWENGSTNNTLTISPQPGSTVYRVTISDICGNEVYDSVTVRVSDMNLGEITTEQVSCYDACDGAAFIDVTNDYEPFTYIYGNSQFFYVPDSLTTTINPNLTGLCPQEYYLKVVDNIGCFIETNFVIDNELNIQLSTGILTSEDLYCEIPENIMLSAEANVANASYLWWNNSNQPTVTFIPDIGVNTYAVTITDACGNIFVDNVEIAVSNMTGDVAVTHENSNNNDGSMIASVDDGIPPYVFYWEQPLNQYGAAVSNLVHDNYSCRITDSRGCVINIGAEVQQIQGIVGSGIEEIVMYPNPTNDVAIIDFGELNVSDVDIRIISITGDVIGVYQPDVSEFETPELVSGSYIVEILLDDKVQSRQRLIITE